MNIIDVAVRRQRTVVTAFLLLLVSGTIVYLGIAKEAEPNVNIPYVFVVLPFPGVSPEDAERLLIRPVEEELRGLEGIEEISAIAEEGVGTILVEFDVSVPSREAETEVRNVVDQVRAELPPGAEEPVVTEITISDFPVLIVSLAGDLPERTLVRLARSLRDDIETIPAVLDVDIAGDRDEVTEIIVDPLRVESYGLIAGNVAAMLGRSNRLVAAGSLESEGGRFAVKLPGLLDDVREIMSLPVKVDGDAVVTFADVAEIRRTFADAMSLARVNGERAVNLYVMKRSGENIIETVAAVRATVARSTRDWPGTVKVSFRGDQSTLVETMVHDLQNHVLAAVILVMIMIVHVLGWRAALLVSLSIPGSFLASIIVIRMLGLTVNMMVLFALILSVGVLIDGAIIVVEYASRRLAEGRSLRDAYVDASKRMAVPVITATATTLTVFLPMLFWPGIVGEFMRYFPITLLATLSASVLMALVFIPVLGTVLGGGVREGSHANVTSASVSGNLDNLTGFAAFYLRCLRLTVTHPGQILVLTACVLVTAWTAYSRYGNGVVFFPSVEMETAQVLVHARGNLSLEQKDGFLREVEYAITPLLGEIESYTTSVGRVRNVSFGTDEDVIGQIDLEFVDWDERRPAVQILDDVRRATVHLAGIRVETREPPTGPPVGKPVQVQLGSTQPELLEPALARLSTFLHGHPGLRDISDDRSSPGIDWQLEIDREQAARFGLDVSAAGDAVRLITAGLEIGSWRPPDADDEVDIVVRFPTAWRTIDQLGEVRIATTSGVVPISNFVERVARPRVSVLHRSDGQRVLTVGAEVAPGYLPSSIVAEIHAWLANANLDPRIEVTFKGEDKEQRESEIFLLNAFIVAIFLMAIILLTQFDSFYDAALILSAVVLSSIGVLFGLLLTNETFSIIATGTGVMALAGVVVNDNIVLVDTFKRLRHETPSVTDAILRTGVQRLRPVVLTTVTTVLGLMPMTLAVGIDLFGREVTIGSPITQWWQNLAIAVVFGLTVATVLTLIVTPAALALRERVMGDTTAGPVLTKT